MQRLIPKELLSATPEEQEAGAAYAGAAAAPRPRPRPREEATQPQDRSVVAVARAAAMLEGKDKAAALEIFEEEIGAVSYQDQGNADYYTAEAIADRIKMMDNWEISAAIALWWRIVPKVPPAENTVCKEEYMRMCGKIHRALCATVKARNSSAKHRPKSMAPSVVPLQCAFGASCVLGEHSGQR